MCIYIYICVYVYIYVYICMPGSFQMVYHGGLATTTGVDFTCVLFAFVDQKSKAVLNRTLRQPTLIEKSILYDKKQGQSGMENGDAQMKFENLKATSIQGRISPTRSHGCPPPTARHIVSSQAHCCSRLSTRTS